MQILANPNLRGATFYPPGHFHSPLLDLKNLETGSSSCRWDGAEYWEHVNLREREQFSSYEALLRDYGSLAFSKQETPCARYFASNDFFPASDAFIFSAVLRKQRPSKIIEVGSGFSSAVLLDTLEEISHVAKTTFIEPYPDRLNNVLRSCDRAGCQILENPVQDVPLRVFQQLEAGDILFIDSSHVAKIGSDLAFLLLRVLPRLNAGVLVHFHDIFYPNSYPATWIRQGRAWNESLFLRALLIGSDDFQVMMFNSFAAHRFPDLFRKVRPEFLNGAPGSLWLKKQAHAS